MRICFVSNPESTHTRRWVNWFARRGHEVLLVADGRSELEWPGMNIFPLVERFNFPMIKYFVWSLELRRLVQKYRPQILHAHRVSSAGWIAAYSGFHPLVVTPWGSDLYQQPQRSRLAAWLAHQVLTRADMVTADSHDLCELAIQYGADMEKTHMVQWGVDTSIFHPGGKPTQLVSEYNLGDGSVILSPRAVKPIYNLDVIVSAIPTVRAALPTAIFILRDYNTDPSYKVLLQKMIQELGVQDAVRWIGRVEPWERNADIYRLADLAVSVASSDGTPGSVLEAMACGVPIIASDLPSLREWITHGENGLLVPPRDRQALSEAILSLLQDIDLRSKFCRYNLKMVKAHADHKQEMLKMEKLYLDLI